MRYLSNGAAHLVCRVWLVEDIELAVALPFCRVGQTDFILA